MQASRTLGIYGTLSMAHSGPDSPAYALEGVWDAACAVRFLPDWPLCLHPVMQDV